MDIYNFINSKDIQEYLRGINYTFTTPEAAFLVYMCKHVTLEEKFQAWFEIIRTMPDCELEEHYFRRKIKSFHQFLREYVMIQKKKLHRFYDEENETCYSFTTGWYRKFNYSLMPDWNKLYSDYEICKREFFKWRNNEGKSVFEIKQDETVVFHKHWLGKDRNVSVRMNVHMQIMEVYSWHNTTQMCTPGFNNDLLTEEEFGTDDAFDMMYFSFPTPFQRGDILREFDCEKDNIHNLMVLDKWDIKECLDDTKTIVDYHTNYHYRFGVNDERIEYYNISECYLDLEKQNPPLNEKGKVLKAFSEYLKGTINCEEFKNRYNEYLITLKENMPGLIYQIIENKEQDNESKHLFEE